MPDRENKMDKIISTKEFYYMTDLKNQIKKMKPQGKTPISQIFNKMQQLTRSVTFLNERVDYLSQKVNGLKKELSSKVEIAESRTQRLYKGFLFSFVALSVATGVLLAVRYLF